MCSSRLFKYHLDILRLFVICHRRGRLGVVVNLPGPPGYPAGGITCLAQRRLLGHLRPRQTSLQRAVVPGSKSSAASRFDPAGLDILDIKSLAKENAVKSNKHRAATWCPPTNLANCCPAVISSCPISITHIAPILSISTTIIPTLQPFARIKCFFCYFFYSHLAHP